MKNRFWVITFSDMTVCRLAESVANINLAMREACQIVKGKDSWDIVKAESFETPFEAKKNS